MILKRLKPIIPILLISSIGLVLGGNVSKAQSNLIPDSSRIESPKNQIGISAPLFSTGMRFIAKTSEGELRNIRFMFHKHLLSTPEAEFYYASNIDWVYHLDFYNKKFQTQFKTWGIAFAPFGMKIEFPAWVKSVTPSARLLGGFIWFDKPFPDERGVNFNFTYQLDLGIDFKVTDNLRLLTTYSFFHHSNAEIARINPGMDNNMLILGLLYDL